MLKKVSKLFFAVTLSELAGVVGAVFTTAAISSWYVFLNKPFFSPPNWLFGPVWTTLYFLMGVSWFLVWIQGWKKRKVQVASYYFFVQLLLNTLWSLSFFGLRSPLLGLVNIIVLWIFIVLTMKKFRPLSKLAFYLLIPYIAWVSFASLLNAAIVVLN